MRRSSAPGSYTTTVEEVPFITDQEPSAHNPSKGPGWRNSPTPAAMFTSKRLGDTVSRWERDADIQQEDHSRLRGSKLLASLVLAYNSIGIIYGDLGTSPLYVFSSIFDNTPPDDPEDYVRVCSLILWTITALVAVKYALIVIRNDDNGQGGEMALFSLLKRQGQLNKPGVVDVNQRISQYSLGGRKRSNVSSHLRRTAAGQGAAPPSDSISRGVSNAPVGVPASSWRQRLVENRHFQIVIQVAVMIGFGMLVGDGILTPSITVISAAEGINVRWPDVSNNIIIGITIAILVVLFMIQRFGTRFIGYSFSPFLMLWFLANVMMAIYNIAKYEPSVFRALGPNYWFDYFRLRKGRAWNQLGGVFLCVTGAEALFADLGHFSRRAIHLSNFLVVYPSIMITYLGQTAYLLHNPDQVANTFWAAIPPGCFYPVFVIATLASIIASQALISAVFQVAKQALNHGFLPRLAVYHTNRKHMGQVYIPVFNYILMVLCVVVVIGFQTSSAMTHAYGLSIVCDMILTTHFTALVLLCVKQKPLWVIIPFYVFYVVLEGMFLSSLTLKIPKGGWFSLVVAAVTFTVMYLWVWGNRRREAYFRARTGKPLNQYITVQDPHARDKAGRHVNQLMLADSKQLLSRHAGVALYYSSTIHGVPPVLHKLTPKYPTLHTVNIFVTNRQIPVPNVGLKERFLVRQLGLPGFYHMVARYGYMDILQQGPDFVHLGVQNILMLLYRAMFDVLAQNTLLADHLGLSKLLPTSAGALADGSALPVVQSIPEHEVHAPPAPPASMFSGPRGNQDEERGIEMVSNSLAAAAEAGGFSSQTFHPLNDPGSSQANVDARARMQLEKVVEELESQPMNKEVPPEHMTAYKYIRALAQEITSITQANAAHETVYMLGRGHARLSQDKGILRAIRRYALELPFQLMVTNLQADADRAFGIPADDVIEIGLLYEV
ncbi:hypothetical protein WJX73_004336 [Symbiochloris irregularis]|uniref:Potassium transporter n=1 Tax=Symbiochloris irregularis TaxID=706552 RepID=A0AAW1PQK0_9CHLO